MIRKYKDKGMFEQEPFGSLGQALLEGTSYGVPSTKQQQNKMNPSLVTPIAKPRLSTPSLSFNSLGKQSELPYKNPNTPQYDLNYRLPSLNTDNGAGGNSVLREGAFGQEQSPSAKGANSGGTTGQTTYGANSDLGVSNAGTGKRPLKLDSVDNYKVKGSGIHLDEWGQMLTPIASYFLNKVDPLKLKEEKFIVNPATGLPYETQQKVRSNIQRGLVGATRNKSTDLMTNAAMAAMAAANAAQQQNDLEVQNANMFNQNIERMTNQKNVVIDNTNKFNKETAMMAHQAKTMDAKRKEDIANNLMSNFGQIASQNRAEQAMKKAKLEEVIGRENQYAFDDYFGESKNASVEAANDYQAVTKTIKDFEVMEANPSIDRNSADYIKAQREYKTAKARLPQVKETYDNARNTLATLQSNANKQLARKQKKAILNSKFGGVFFKKGGSLSVSDRKELKEHEFALKERLESAKQRAKEANERYKELKKQELEFRKSLTKSSMEGYKIIDNFYKKYKK